MGGSLPKLEADCNEELKQELFNNTVATLQTTWKGVSKDPKKLRETGFQIYKNFFSKHPEYRNLFKDDVSLLLDRIISMISTVIEGLGDLKTLRKQIFALGKIHAKHGVPTKSYSHFIDSIICGMKQTLGEECTPRLEFCFRTMFNWAASTMICAYETSSPRRSRRLSPRKNKNKNKTDEKVVYNVADFPDLQKFENCLEGPICLEYFHLFLTSRFTEENILFYIDIMKFKNTKISISESETKMTKMAKDIHDKYICLDGPTPVNIPFGVKEQIQESLKCPTATMFDKCLTEVQNLMRKGQWVSFLASETCQALCAYLSGDITMAISDHTVAILSEMSQ